MADLSVNIGDLKLCNPVMTASGTFGYGKEFEDFEMCIRDRYTKEIFYSIIQEMFPELEVQINRVNTNPLKYL